MSSSIPVRPIRRAFPKDLWRVPEPYGPDGWHVVSHDRRSSVIISVGRREDGAEWVHASIAHDDHVPSYLDLVALHRAIGGGWALQVFAPASDHISIHPNALHLWGRLDGARSHPDFGVHGTI